MFPVTAQGIPAHHELYEYFWSLYETTALTGNMDCFGAQRESSMALNFSPIPEAQLTLKPLWIKLQWFPQDFVGFVHFYVFLQLLAFSLCSLRHLGLLQGLGKRKIAVCIYKQTIKIKSTMYWHRRIRGVIHMFLGSARLLLSTANGISSPALTSVLIAALFICASFFLCQEAPTLGQILQNTIVLCRREVRSAFMDPEEIGPRWPLLALCHGLTVKHLPLTLCSCALLCGSIFFNNLKEEAPQQALQGVSRLLHYVRIWHKTGEKNRQTDGQHVVRWETNPFPVTHGCKPHFQTTGQVKSQGKERTCYPQFNNSFKYVPRPML